MNSGRDEIRTHMTLSQRILSPPRIPFRHTPKMDRFKGSLLQEDKTLILSIDTKGFANRKLYLSNFQDKRFNLSVCKII